MKGAIQYKTDEHFFSATEWVDFVIFILNMVGLISKKWSTFYSNRAQKIDFTINFLTIDLIDNFKWPLVLQELKDNLWLKYAALRSESDHDKYDMDHRTGTLAEIWSKSRVSDHFPKSNPDQLCESWINLFDIFCDLLSVI